MSGDASCLASAADLDKVPEMIWCADEQGKLEYVNRAWREYTGCETSQATGDDWLELVHPDDRSAVAEATKQAIDTGVFDAEFRLRHRDGGYGVFRSRARLEPNGSGQAKSWYGTLSDISDLRKAERLAEERRIELREALHAGWFGTWRVDLCESTDRRDAITNQILGLPASDAVFPLSDFVQRVHADDRSLMEKHWRALVSDGTPYDLRHRIVRPDGSVRWVRDRARVVRNHDSEITHATGVIVDITDRVQREHCLELERAVVGFVAAASSVEAIGHELLDVINSELGTDTAELWMKRQGRLTLAASRTLRHETDESGGAAVTDRRADTRVGVVESAAMISAPVWREGGGGGVCFAFPLLSGQELLGVIGLSASEPIGRGPQLTETLTRIGREIGRLMGRDALEDHRRRINNELRHRVKNLLSITQALVSRAAATAASPDAFVETVEGSLRALATSNDLLTEDASERARLARLAELIVQPYRSQNAAQISIEGPPLVLTRRATQSLALILHELVSNAAKYGALVTSREGEVSIGWSVETEPGNGSDIHLRWAERFGAPIATASGPGSGIEMIRRTTAYELNGKASHKFTANGLECVLVFPAARATVASPEQ